MQSEPAALFVYGTLQRGEERADMWPHPPTSIEWATTRGTLYDLGPYPALTPGDSLVRGELWHIAPADMPATLEALDEIECYGQDGVDLYVRRIVECQTDANVTCRAFTYFIADADVVSSAQVVPPRAAGWCHWSRGSD